MQCSNGAAGHLAFAFTRVNFEDGAFCIMCACRFKLFIFDVINFNAWHAKGALRTPPTTSQKVLKRFKFYITTQLILA